MQQLNEVENPGQKPGPVVLSVDDDDNDAFLLRTACKARGFGGVLEFAMDGQEAIQYLERVGEHSKPDLVLLDLKMPRLDGVEVLQWIRRQKGLEDMPVAMFTSSSRPEDIRRAYAGGANVYLIKPSTYDELMDFVMALRKSLEAEEGDLQLLATTPAFRADPAEK